MQTAQGDWSGVVRRARERALETGAVDRSAADLSPVVADSWSRSLAYGLEADRVTPAWVGADLDGTDRLVDVVASVVDARLAVLDQTMGGLSLTDHDGRLLRQWVGDDALTRAFEAHDISPGFSVAESEVGTSSGICLLTGRPTMVRGPEHFSERWQEFTCAGVPIVHPVSRRTIGSLDLTCRYRDTSPVMLVWVMELVAEIERLLRTAGGRSEQALLDAFLAENRDARHPVVAVNDQTVITNAAAARLLGNVDQVLLWEHAARRLVDGQRGDPRLTLGDGRRLRVGCRPVSSEDRRAGAVLVLQQDDPVVLAASPTEEAAGLPGLVGRGARWTTLCRRVGHGGGRDLLLTGEPGTGKCAVARALAGGRPCVVVEATDAVVEGPPAWLRRLERVLADPAHLVVLRHLDALDEATARAVGARLEAPGRARVIATALVASTSASPLLARFGAVVEVPALRDRTEDLPLLLAELSARARAAAGGPPVAGGHGRAAGVHWMPDAVQALSRLPWPGNVAALEAIVGDVLSRNHTGYLGVADLPANLVASASRRRLAGLEEVEARAITEALRAAGGNKHRAAEALGIARSTLYRKIRALGIDLSVSTF